MADPGYRAAGAGGSSLIGVSVLALIFSKISLFSFCHTLGYFFIEVAKSFMKVGAGTVYFYRGLAVGIGAYFGGVIGGEYFGCIFGGVYFGGI